jgi:hypothetical protein
MPQSQDQVMKIPMLMPITARGIIMTMCANKKVNMITISHDSICSCCPCWIGAYTRALLVRCDCGWLLALVIVSNDNGEVAVALALPSFNSWAIVLYWWLDFLIVCGYVYSVFLMRGWCQMCCWYFMVIILSYHRPLCHCPQHCHPWHDVTIGSPLYFFYHYGRDGRVLLYWYAFFVEALHTPTIQHDSVPCLIIACVLHQNARVLRSIR